MPDAHLVETNTRRQWLLAAFVAGFYPLPGLKRAFSIIGILLALWGLNSAHAPPLACSPR